MLGRRLTATLAAAALLGAVAILSAGPATATFPGKNGRIVYALKLTGEGADIYSVGPNGGQPKKLTTSPRGDVEPAVSADGATVVYVGSTEAGDTELFTIPIAGGTPTQVTTLPDVFEGNPSFSRDGTQIVFTGAVAGSNPDIWIVNADGSDPHPLITGPDAETDPSFSPVREKILFATRPDGGGRQDIFDANTDGTGVRNLTARYKSNENPRYLEFQDPSYSPDGRRILVATNFDNEGKFVLDPFIMTAGGGGLRPIGLRTRGYEVEPVFSPDGKRICFARYGDRKSTLFTVKTNGRDLRAVAELTNHVNSGNPDWQRRP